MSNHYYQESVPYRSHPPLRGRTPPSSPSAQHYSPAPLPRQHYSLPRNPRPRTPPRNFSPPNDTVIIPLPPFFLVVCALMRENW